MYLNSNGSVIHVDKFGQMVKYARRDVFARI